MNINQSIAIVSDIHGNRWALEAVLADINQRRINTILNLGDSLYGPLDPAGTADLLIKQPNLISISGNEDRILFSPPRPDDSPTLIMNRRVLGQNRLTWLSAFPPTTQFEDEFFLCHGTPQRDDQQLCVNITALGVVEKNKQDLESELASIPQPIILCGHDHTPRLIKTEQKTILNPGSVGLPAYTDTLPYPHGMQTGSPHAQYAVISNTPFGLHFEQIALPYDWETAAKTAEKNQRPDWVKWLRSGLAD